MSLRSESKKGAAPTTNLLSRTISKDAYTKLDAGGMEELRVAFNMLDRNKDGQLSVSELQAMLKRFGINVPDELVLDLFLRCSHTGSGQLTETEFLEFVSTHLTEEVPSTSEEELMAAFRVFDKDQNGFITRDELKRAMDMMGEELSDEDIDSMITMADLNKDGKIDYEEFTRLLS